MYTGTSFQELVLRDIFTTDGEFISKIIVSDRQIRSVNADDSYQSVKNKKQYCFLFNNAIIFPGLINSHDHLDFNLFPRLGNRIYNNYLEWGTDIHQQNKEIINAVLQVPKALRTQWGIYKNLLNGITTVFNHGRKPEISYSPIDVFPDQHSLHSVKLEKYWKWKLNNPFNVSGPYVIHIGEGTDADSHKEIDTLIKWNILHKKLIGIHGVAMNVAQAASFKALVWCPDSNFFLLNATAPINELKQKTAIIFGTDSTVSAGWNIWEQLRIARKTKLLTDKELFESLTTIPSEIRGLNGAGRLEENANADIVVAEKKSANAMDAFFESDPGSLLMILKKGNIIFFDEGMLDQISSQQISTTAFCRMYINNRIKYVKGDLHDLIKQIKRYTKDIVFPIEPA
jgi:cytosine/adenosine deaminase-related metal-dependent hydrolase